MLIYRKNIGVFGVNNKEIISISRSLFMGNLERWYWGGAETINILNLK